MVGNTSALFLWPVLSYLRALIILVQVALSSPFNHMFMAGSKQLDSLVFNLLESEILHS